MRFNRSRITVRTVVEQMFHADEVMGYKSTLVADGEMFSIGFYKDVSGKWHAADLFTGGTFVSGKRTRLEAAEEVLSLSAALKRRADENRFERLARAQVLQKLREEPMPERIYLMEVDELSKRLREQHESGQAMEVAAESSVVSLATMRGKLSAWDNVAVTQKNERCLIWAFGDLAGHEDELAEIGFKESRNKGGWWIRPTE